MIPEITHTETLTASAVPIILFLLSLTVHWLIIRTAVVSALKRFQKIKRSD